MARPKKSKEEKQKQVIRSLLSEIADSYILIAILPTSEIAVLERTENIVHSIALETILERLLDAKERERELREMGGDLLGGESESDENNL